VSGRSAKAARRAAGTKRVRRKPVQPSKLRARSASQRAAWSLAVVAVAVVGLYFLSHRSSTPTAGAGAYPYAVGSPGPGHIALGLRLPSTAGGTFDLANYRGKQSVLLFFQEGLTCEPCWTQVKALQKDAAKFHALGIGPIVSVTTDPLGLLRQKVHDEGITLPVLSDSSAAVSSAWTTNQYQMVGMGDRNGHSFVVVGKSGRILWRADYGGAPKYTMYLPDSVLLAQMRKGLRGAA